MVPAPEMVDVNVNFTGQDEDRDWKQNYQTKPICQGGKSTFFPLDLI